MPNSVVLSHRIPDQLQAAELQNFYKFKQMVPDKPHPQTYAGKVRKNSQEAKKPKGC